MEAVTLTNTNQPSVHSVRPAAPHLLQEREEHSCLACDTRNRGVALNRVSVKRRCEAPGASPGAPGGPGEQRGSSGGAAGQPRAARTAAESRRCRPGRLRPAPGGSTRAKLRARPSRCRTRRGLGERCGLGLASRPAGSGSHLAQRRALKPTLAAPSPDRSPLPANPPGPAAPEHPPRHLLPCAGRPLPAAPTARGCSGELALLPQPGPEGGRRCPRPRGRRPYLSR